MASTLKLFLTSLLLLLCISQGMAGCTLSDIVVTQTRTGGVVGGDPVYEVVVNNDCICVQSSVLLHCPGFNSVLPVDPAVFGPVGNGTCVVNNNLPLAQDVPIKFKYAWSTQFDLTVASAQISCS